MMPAVPFATIGPFHAGTFIIFTVAAFFALCAAVSYLVATAFENNRRNAIAQERLRAQFHELESHPGDAIVKTEDDEPHRHLQWPGDNHPGR
jgi:hypothetical protein